MQTPSDARQVRLFCLEHGRPTIDYAGATIFCDRDEQDGHLLARDFPHADDWEYCCDCECFYALDQARKARAAGGWDVARCPACGRESIRHYLCAGCKVVSHKSGDKVRAVYSITATGLVRPTCPGCLAAAPPAVEEHECHVLGLSFTTARASCPFCKLAIARESPPAAVQGAPARGGEADRVEPIAQAEPTAKAKPSPTSRPEPPQVAKAAPSDDGRSAPAARTASEARAAKDSAPLDELPRKITTPQQTPTEADKPRRRFTRRAVLSAVAVVLTLTYVAATAFYFLSNGETGSELAMPTSVAGARQTGGEPRSRLVPKERLDSAGRAASEARDRADDLKSKWERIRAMTIRNGKNPDDPRQAPRTTAAKKEYEAAAEEAKARSQEYERLVNQDRQAREELQTADASPAATSAPPPQGNSAGIEHGQQPEQDAGVLADILPWLAPALAGLALIFAAALGWWAWWLHRETLETRYEVEQQHIRLRVMSDKFLKQRADLEALSSRASRLDDEVRSKLVRVLRDVAEVRKELDGGRRAVPAGLRAASVPAGDGRATPVRASRPPVAEAPRKDEPDFPVPVKSFLARIPDERQTPLKLDPLKNILVRDQEGPCLLLLVRDVSVSGGQLCMIPALTLLPAALDFHYNYEKFYDCARPRAGQVWIVSPALVDKVDGGWKLLERGVLEIRD